MPSHCRLRNIYRPPCGCCLIVYRSQRSKTMPELTKPVLQAQNLYKAFGRHKVLRGVSFAVYPGTLVGIVGENGAGKSTLLRILAGELRPGSGEVLLDGALGYCPQAVVLNDALTVNQHLDYFRAAYNIGDLTYANDLINKLG